LALYTSAEVTRWKRSPIGVPHVRLASTFSLSPISVMPAWALALRPSKSVSRMKLTTPLTASDPYAAEAPPVTTSTRSISDSGSSEISTAPVRVAGTTRRPSSNVSVRLAPMPRRLTKLAPEAPDEPNACVCGVSLLRNCGSCTSASTSVVGAIVCNASALIAVTGVGVCMPSTRMREPVTVISSRPPACSTASCACTVVSDTSAIATATARRTCNE
jgi:hypothetical protein